MSNNRISQFSTPLPFSIYSEAEDDELANIKEEDEDGNDESQQVNCDIISELYVRSTHHIIDHLLKFLDPCDYVHMVSVSKTWQSAVNDNNKANDARLKYLKERRALRKAVGQENWPIKKKLESERDQKNRSACKTMSHRQESDTADADHRLRTPSMYLPPPMSARTSSYKTTMLNNECSSNSAAVSQSTSKYECHRSLRFTPKMTPFRKGLSKAVPEDNDCTLYSEARRHMPLSRSSRKNLKRL